ncbi:MAG: acetylglutamate kinase [Myxococcales bacterium]|nr:acetylglutamate kinase [Myxococcales bacterium]
MRTTQDIITRLLRNIGTRKEVEQYLKQFSSVDSRKFAVIKVGGNIIARELDSLASSLTFLHHVGLYPIVLHGAGPQLDETLAAAGIVTSRVDGLRVTPPEALDVARRVFQRENLRLVDALEELGTRARPILSGVFEAEPIDRERLGLVGRVTRIHLESIEASIRSGHLPILASLGETAAGQILNINADVAARALALALEPFKIIFLTETGGLLDGDGQLISAINLAEDYDVLMEQPWLHSGMRLKIQEIKQLLDALPHTSSVSITSPDHLAKELFTHRGSGTLLRQGERVDRFDDTGSFESVDRARLRKLLEDCFQRRLAPGYFDEKKFFRIYLSDAYRATAILTREGAIPYLDKFAVTQEAQGAGVGGSMWARMQRDNPRLFWRSRHDNAINGWYFEHAQGSHKSGQWTVFWYGLDGFEEIRGCVERALALPPTLEEPQA